MPVVLDGHRRAAFRAVGAVGDVPHPAGPLPEEPPEDARRHLRLGRQLHPVVDPLTGPIGAVLVLRDVVA